jgi:predicted PurR-regulated permease PerM
MYFKSIGQGVLYGVISILIVFMVLEDNVLTPGGRTGYMWQSGAVLFFNIIMVVNFKVLVMSYRISIGLLIAVFGSIILYWFVYWLESLMFSDFKLRDSLYE